jgi:hypothetical protein
MPYLKTYNLFTLSAVESVADVMVSWNTNSIISAIRDLSL